MKIIYDSEEQKEKFLTKILIRAGLDYCPEHFFLKNTEECTDPPKYSPLCIKCWKEAVEMEIEPGENS